MLPGSNPAEVPYVGTVIGPYVGWKCLEYDGRKSPKVVSPYKPSFKWWPERTLVKADCRPTVGGKCDHDIPDERHSCGYYLYYDLDDAIADAKSFTTTRPIVSNFVAMVCAWGKVIHHDSGLRSSHMEIVALHDGPYSFRDCLKDVASEMGIPCLGRDELYELAKETGVLVVEGG